MDINYLLFWQDFRSNIDNALTPFMEQVSLFAITWLILIPIFYYWCVDKKKGLYVLASYSIAMIITPVTKLTVCAYRPWIRDSRIIPAGDAITTATGYSFPSGHTTCGLSLAGGMAAVTWKEKRTRWLSVIFIIYCVLVPFSRNYLGVHTPQDVIVGTLVALFSLFAASKIFRYLEEHPEKENYFLLGGLIICCAGLVYITVKSYPMTMTEEGKLLVDPQVMMRDGYGDLGRTIGFIIGRFIERKWVHFEAAGLRLKGILLCAAGLIAFALIQRYTKPVFVQMLGEHWGRLAYSVMLMVYCIALFPMVIRLVNKNENEKPEGAGNVNV